METINPSLPDLTVISGHDLAKALGFSALTSQCRAWFKKMGIRALPHRRNFYDPKHVRERLDITQGIGANISRDHTTKTSLVSQRKARKHAQRQSAA